MAVVFYFFMSLRYVLHCFALALDILATAEDISNSKQLDFYLGYFKKPAIDFISIGQKFWYRGYEVSKTDQEFLDSMQ